MAKPEVIMPGVIVADHDMEGTLATVKEVAKTMAGAPKHQRDLIQKLMFGSVENLPKALADVKRYMELSEQFRAVARDESVTRKLRVKDRYGEASGIEVPLVFYTKLPTKELVVTLKKQATDGQRYSVSSRTPIPPPEAIKAIQDHKAKFDHLEVWWVPNDIMVKKLPDPDPIVVGCVKLQGATEKLPFYFELHRWIDETIEDGYFSREAY